MKRLLLSLSVSMVLLIVLGTMLVRIDQEARYFSDAAAVSEQWEQKLRKETSSPLIVFAGGSEVRTGINPELYQERYGLRVVNAGLHAGFGLVCNVIAAVPRLQAGDTLVVSVAQPSEDCENLPLMGLRFIWRREGLQGVCSPLFPCLAPNLLKSVRFNQQTDWLYLKAFSHGRLVHWYDSRACIHQPSGWMEILCSQDVSAMEFSPYRVVKEEDFASTLQFLQNLKKFCDARSVKLVCFLPWRYCSCAEERPMKQRDNIRYALLLTQHHIPVLKDEKLGCVSDADLFSDTELHPNRKGVALYAECLGKSLIEQSYWPAEELRALLASGE